MTTSPTSPSALSSPDAIRAALSDAGVRQRIEGIVRRRVPPDHVSDVFQQILCDALASGLAPANPAEVPRWLFGVTRHKVADHHRTSRRRATDALDPARIAGPAAPLEARSLLREVIADAGRDARGAETMRWLAREAEGERLDELAREVSLPPATVRQRVSRLRRWLRKRWLREALSVAAAGVLLVAVYRSSPRAEITPMVADPMDDAAAAASAALQGKWHLTVVEPDAALDPARRALVDAAASTTEVEIRGSHVTFSSAARHGERQIEAGPVEDGRFEVRMVDDGRVQRATASFDAAGRLVIIGREGSWKGRVVLTR